jgi:DNA-directed RNA polymerase specialized sigma24 family protein
VTAIGPEPPEEDTSIIVRKCAAGELGALDKLVHRYNRKMILMVESHTNKEIADLLDVNERTIERRVATIRVRYFRYHHKDLL